MRLQIDQEEFHKHLDSCQQCAANPFNLCQIGAKLLTQTFGISDKPKRCDCGCGDHL